MNVESGPESVRSTIVKWIKDDVMGPRNGPDEVLPRSEVPTQSYLTGILFSRTNDTDEDEQEQEQTELEGGDGDDDHQDERVNTMANLRQSSFGLTCTISNDTSKICANIEYGTYDLVSKDEIKKDKSANRTLTVDCDSVSDNNAGVIATDNDIVANADINADIVANVIDADTDDIVTAQEGTKKHTKGMVYHRTPQCTTCEIHLDDSTQKEIPLSTNKKFTLKYYVKKHERGISLSVFVVNNHISDGDCKDEFKRCMFQPKLVLSSCDGEKIFIDNNMEQAQNVVTNEEEKYTQNDSVLFDMLFRKKNNFATGHGCAVRWEECKEGDKVDTLETTFVPEHTVPKIRPREMDVKGLDMEALFKITDIAEYRKILSAIPDKYEMWIQDELESKTEKLATPFQQAAQTQIKECKEALKRMRKGIDIISTNDKAAEAFAFANRAMHLQMSYGKWARENIKRGKVDGPKPKEYGGQWRPFQMAFFLMNIEAITNPRSEDRSTADLLWFATGGGKTEAYLGIIAFTIAYRRLRNDGYFKYGTTVMMRYTLRLLTLQQFHRAATLVCACEYIRRYDSTKWGKEPFLVGLWVGSSTTPNTLEGDYGAKVAIQDAKNGHPPQEHNPMQVVSCPWCGSKINEYCYEVYGIPMQCRIYCPNKACAFSKNGSGERNLPVLVTDEDIYKRCPSLLIGTVDKFAQMARKWETRAIFGRVNKYCEMHGFVTAELADNCNTHRKYKTFTFAPSQLEPPELIIQDELHLVAGPLGTLAGHYETAVDMLCINQNGIRPKIIASTATTRGAGEQIRNLFNRKTSRIFPPQGIDFGQSFFAEEVSLDEDPGKTYVGVCTTAKSRLTILGRISASILRCIRSIQERIGQNNFTYRDIDSYYTLVSYFNTLRDLGGASKMYDDTVPGYIQRLYNNFEDKIDKDDKYKNQQLEKVELTSRIDSNDIPNILKKLEMNLDDKTSALDLLLCTNMLSVGVDISRLGVMIVNGQPKNHSEYIQATGRIGRNTPGLIVTSYNPIKPRDLSHYENFGYYHSTLHKNVEPVTLTPFASRARDRALFGILVSIMRLYEMRLAKNNDACDFDKGIKFIIDAITMIRNELSARVEEIDPEEQKATLADLDKLIDKWHDWALEYDQLKYTKNLYEKAKKQPDIKCLLRSAFNSDDNGLVSVPDSLRDAEEMIRIKYHDDNDSSSYHGDAK